MPPYMNTAAVDRTCQQCSGPFRSKRPTAKFCSDLCRNRSRPPRTRDPEANRQWYRQRAADPAYRERLAEQGRARHAAVHAWLDAYKVATGCVDCGYDAHPAALDFDHVRGTKTINVCFARSIAAAQREISKCDVRCANCHRVRHAGSYEAANTDALQG